MPLKREKKYVFSCYLKADRPDVPVMLQVYQNTRGTRRRTVQVDQEWKRYSFPFTPSADYAWAAVGIDLQKSEISTATLWVDAVQFERADQPTDYVPRSQLESFIETPVPGNIFTEPEEGMTIDVCLWNGTDATRMMTGRLLITDFLDREVLCSDVHREVEPGVCSRFRLRHQLADRKGFFRVHWLPAGDQVAFKQTLRCAVIDPYEHAGSPFGMNHAYPWNFLLQTLQDGRTHLDARLVGQVAYRRTPAGQVGFFADRPADRPCPGQPAHLLDIVAVCLNTMEQWCRLERNSQTDARQQLSPAARRGCLSLPKTRRCFASTSRP